MLSRYEHALRGFAAKLTEEQVKALKKDPDIASVVPNERFQGIESTRPVTDNKPASSSLMAQITPWGVNRVKGHLINGAGKKAWILDTGIDLDHPDLNVDVANSVSFISSSPNDLDGHGTHIAGIIGAIDNSIGVVGVANGASLVSVQVLGQNGQGTTQALLDGIDHVANNATSGDIVNMSVSAGGINGTVDNAVTNAANSGVRFVIAAGNYKTNANYLSPGRANHYNIWTVSAYDINDNFAVSFSCNPSRGSNFGNPPIDYSAPGNNILSTWINGTVETQCGTSMAAPHIAGILLVNGSAYFGTDGTISNDPDGNSDVIMVATLERPALQHSVYNNSPKLTWNNVHAADSYKVYRKFETGSWVLVSTTTGTSFTDTPIYNPNLQTAISPPYNYEDFYTYKVHAHTNAGDVSGASNLRYFIYPTCTGPGCAS